MKRGDEEKKETELGGWGVRKQMSGVHSVKALEARAQFTGPHPSLRAVSGGIDIITFCCVTEPDSWELGGFRHHYVCMLAPEAG